MYASKASDWSPSVQATVCKPNENSESNVVCKAKDEIRLDRSPYFREVSYFLAQERACDDKVEVLQIPRLSTSSLSQTALIGF